jgi:hypothetical protein
MGPVGKQAGSTVVSILTLGTVKLKLGNEEGGGGDILSGLEIPNSSERLLCF